MSTITLAEFRAAAMKVVEKLGPDFVYPRNQDGGPYCTYAPSKGAPLGCLIGATIRELGFHVPTSMEGRGASTVLEKVWCYPPDDVKDWADEAQSAQDGGDTWGDAIAHADDMLDAGF